MVLPHGHMQTNSIVILFQVILTSLPECYSESEAKLIGHLLRAYNPFVRPALPEEALVVQYGILLNDIKYFNFATNDVTVDIWENYVS
jgi:hypothetical protein